MAIEQLVNYFRQNMNRFSIDQLKNSLIQQGYPKAEVDQAASIATGNAPPLMASPQQAQSSGQSKFDSMSKDPKFKATVGIFVVCGVIFALIKYFFSMIVSGITMRLWFSQFDFLSLLMSILYSAIAAAVGGAFFYFFFDNIKSYIKKSAFLSRHIDSLFKLFWKPSLVGFIIAAIFAILGFITIGSSPIARGILAFTGALGGPSFGSLIIGAIVTLVGNLIASYVYAKIISEKLGNYYPW